MKKLLIRLAAGVLLAPMIALTAVATPVGFDASASFSLSVFEVDGQTGNITSDLFIDSSLALLSTAALNDIDDPVGCAFPICPALRASENGSGSTTSGGFSSPVFIDISAPLAPILETGDGVSAGISILSDDISGGGFSSAALAADFDFFIDNSGTVAHIVTFELSRTMNVEAKTEVGDDAFAVAFFSLFDGELLVDPPFEQVTILADGLAALDASELTDSFADGDSVFFDIVVAADSAILFTGTLDVIGEAAVVPEPGMLTLFGIGLIGLGAIRYRDKIG